MKDKPVKYKEFIDDIDMRAAKHLVKLGIGKDWKKIYEGMKRRRKKRERST
jgi:predicted phage gp36 major capsid-like protein